MSLRQYPELDFEAAWHGDKTDPCLLDGYGYEGCEHPLARAMRLYALGSQPRLTNIVKRGTVEAARAYQDAVHKADIDEALARREAKGRGVAA